MSPISYLDVLEAHSNLVQALAGIATTLVAACALLYTVLTLRQVQRQTRASVAMTTESFRPIVEVVGGALGPQRSEVFLKNKGAGPALNIRWRIADSKNWRSGHGNVLAASEEVKIVVLGPCREQGLVFSYESVSQRGELLTFVNFDQSAAAPMNQHSFSTESARTRTGWTTANPELAIPGYHPDLIASMPATARLRHWWRLKRGLERRL